MQMLDDLEHTSRSLNACIYYEISVSVGRIIKDYLMTDGLPYFLATKHHRIPFNQLKCVLDHCVSNLYRTGLGLMEVVSLAKYRNSIFKIRRGALVVRASVS